MFELRSFLFEVRMLAFYGIFCLETVKMEWICWFHMLENSQPLLQVDLLDENVLGSHQAGWQELRKQTLQTRHSTFFQSSFLLFNIRPVCTGIKRGSGQHLLEAVGRPQEWGLVVFPISLQIYRREVEISETGVVPGTTM